MDEHWEEKRRRSPEISSGRIDDWYRLGRQHGALGGKLVGAGGGGFLLFYAEDRAPFRHTMLEAGLVEVRFRFDFSGTITVVSQ
jgi:D-glycero-alpha-D-manno-heptose-7-phosphate kinase